MTISREVIIIKDIPNLVLERLLEQRIVSMLSHSRPTGKQQTTRLSVLETVCLSHGNCDHPATSHTFVGARRRRSMPACLSHFRTAPSALAALTAAAFVSAAVQGWPVVYDDSFIT